MFQILKDRFIWKYLQIVIKEEQLLDICFLCHMFGIGDDIQNLDLYVFDINESSKKQVMHV